MSIDMLLWIVAIICFGVATVGTYKSSPPMIMFGWIGLAFGALTFIV